MLLCLTTLAAVCAAALAHNEPHYCSELMPNGLVREECTSLAWVEKYSQSLNGDGPEQVRIFII